MQKPKLNHVTSSNNSTSVNGASGSGSSIISPGNGSGNFNGKINTTNSSTGGSSGINSVTASNSKTFNLPESLEMIQKCEYFPTQRHRWNTNEEIASILIGFDRHSEWLSKEVKIRPKSGSLMLYSRKCVRYRRDGYCWKKRKDGKTTREDHMKLKVQGTECIYGCYVHSAILPTFHRRCYWLLQNPDIVLVHYLNVPFTDDNKIISPTLNYFADNKKEWTKDELISELKPMFFSENEPDINNELEISTAETIESIVTQLMTRQRAKVKALEEASDINARALTALAVASSSSSSSSTTNCSSASLNSSSLNCATNTVVSTSAVSASNVHFVTSSNIANSTQFTSNTTASNGNSSLIPVSTAALTHHRILHPISGPHAHAASASVNQPSDLLIKGQQHQHHQQQHHQQRSLATNLLGGTRCNSLLGQGKGAPTASPSTVVAVATATGADRNLNCANQPTKNESTLDNTSSTATSTTTTTLLTKGPGLQLIKRATNSTTGANAVDFGHRSTSNRGGGLQLLQLTAPTGNSSNCKSAIALTSNSSHRVSPITNLVGGTSGNVKSTTKSGNSPTSLIFNLSHLQNGSGILILPNLNSATSNTSSGTNGHPSPGLANCANGANIGHVNGGHTGNSAPTGPVTLLYSRNGNNNNQQCTNGQVDTSTILTGSNNNGGHDGHIISTPSNMKQQRQQHQQQQTISMDMTPATATTASSSSSSNSLCPDGKSNNNNNVNDNPPSPGHGNNGLNFTTNASMATECDMEMSIDIDTSNLSHINISPAASSNDAAVVTGRNMNLQSTSSINSSSPATNETPNAITETDGDLVDVDPCDLSNYTGFTDSDSPNGNSPSGSISRFAFGDHNSPDSDNSRGHGQVSLAPSVSSGASTVTGGGGGSCGSNSLRNQAMDSGASSKQLFHHQRGRCNFNTHSTTTNGTTCNGLTMRLDGLYHCTDHHHENGAGGGEGSSLGHVNKSQECNVSAKTVKDDPNNCPMMDLTAAGGSASSTPGHGPGGTGGDAGDGNPSGTGGHSAPVVVDDDDHAMDFIENDLSPCDGDLFNLDTFDMLSEFSNLDDFTTSSNTTSSTFHFLMKSTTTHGNNGNKDALNGNINDGTVMASTTTQSTSSNSMMHPLAIGQSDSVNNNHHQQHQHHHQHHQPHNQQHQRSPTTTTTASTNCHGGRHQLNSQQQHHHHQQQQQHHQQPQSQLNCGSDSNNMQTSCHESMAQSSDFILTSSGGHTANNNHGHDSASNSNNSLVDSVPSQCNHRQLHHHQLRHGGHGPNNSPSNSMVDSVCNNNNNNNCSNNSNSNNSNSNNNNSNNNLSIGHSPCGTSSDSSDTTTVVHSQPQITDYSPEWSYPEGGMKVLVAGPWYSSAVNYSISFDGISVPTSLVQNGVLRCYSPAHEPGFVTLQVSISGGNIVSNSVIFEYRDHPSTPSQCSEDYFSVDDNVLKFCLLERLELLESHVANASSNVPPASTNNLSGGPSSGTICRSSPPSKVSHLVNHHQATNNCNNEILNINNNCNNNNNEESVKSEEILNKTIHPQSMMKMKTKKMMMMNMAMVPKFVIPGQVEMVQQKMKSGGKIIENQFEGCIRYECNASQDFSESHKYHCNSGNLSVPGINVCLSHVQSNCIGPNSSQSVGTSDNCFVNSMKSNNCNSNLQSETLYTCNITPSAFEKRFERLFESISQLYTRHWSEYTWEDEFVHQLHQSTYGRRGHFSLSILHLVSALGYSDLLKLLLNYNKCHRQSTLVVKQINTRLLDDHNCTPIIWSTARGHIDCSIILAHFDPVAVNLANKEHFTPLQVAILNGHEQLLGELFKCKCNSVKEIFGHKSLAAAAKVGGREGESSRNFLADERREKNGSSSNSMDGKVYCTSCSCFCRNNNSNNSNSNARVDDINCTSGKSGANNITSNAHGCTCDCCCIYTSHPFAAGDGRSNRTYYSSSTSDADATFRGKEVQVNANKCTNHTVSEAIVFHPTQQQQSNCNGLHGGYCQVVADSVTDSVATCATEEVKIETSKCNKDKGPTSSSATSCNDPTRETGGVTYDSPFDNNNCSGQGKNDEQVNDEAERSNPKVNDDLAHDTLLSTQKKCSLNPQYKRGVNGISNMATAKFTGQKSHPMAHQVTNCQKTHLQPHLLPPPPPGGPLAGDFTLCKLKNEPMDGSNDILGGFNELPALYLPFPELNFTKTTDVGDDDNGNDGDGDDDDDDDGSTNTTVLSFAENVIAAMPERIKQSDQLIERNCFNKRRGVNLATNLTHPINRCNNNTNNSNNNCNSSDKSHFFMAEKSVENTSTSHCHHIHHHHHHHHHHHYHYLDHQSKNKSNLNCKSKQSQAKSSDARVASSPQSSSTCTSASSSSCASCLSNSCTSSELKFNCYNKLQQHQLEQQVRNRHVHNYNSLDESSSNLSENNLHSNEFSIASGALVDAKFDPVECQQQVNSYPNTEKDNILTSSSSQNNSGCYGGRSNLLKSPNVHQSRNSHTGAAMDVGVNLASPASLASSSTCLLQRTSSVDAGIESMASSLIDVASDTSVNSNPSSPLSASLFSSSSTSSLSSLSSCGLDFTTIFSPTKSSTSSSVDSILINSPNVNSTDSLSEFFKPPTSESYVIKNLKSQNNLNSVKRWHESNSKFDSYELFKTSFNSFKLSDYEQRELYSAAKVIQKAYRSYKEKCDQVPSQLKLNLNETIRHHHHHHHSCYSSSNSSSSTTSTSFASTSTGHCYCHVNHFKKCKKSFQSGNELKLNLNCNCNEISSSCSSAKCTSNGDINYTLSNSITDSLLNHCNESIINNKLSSSSSKSKAVNTSSKASISSSSSSASASASSASTSSGLTSKSNGNVKTLTIKESQAAILIQSYYRRYKQFVYYKQMTKAASIIQNQFRSYCSSKRHKKAKIN